RLFVGCAVFHPASVECGAGKIGAPMLVQSYSRHGVANRRALKLRVPHWSRSTRVKLNGKPVNGVTPGNYLVLDRSWKHGDIVDIEFDFSLHFWAGEREYVNNASIYHRPILYTE